MCRIVPWASCTICLVRPQTQDYTYIYVFVFVFVRVFILMNTCDTFCRFAFCSHLLAWNKSNYKSTIRKKKVCTAPFLKISSFFSCCFHSIFAVAVCVNMNGSHVTWHATNHGTNHDVHLQIENCREKKINKIITTHSRMRRHSTNLIDAIDMHFSPSASSGRCLLEWHLFMAVGLSSSEYVTN